MNSSMPPPPRWRSPPVGAWVALVLVGAVAVNLVSTLHGSAERLSQGADNAVPFLLQAFPPDFSRIGPVTKAMWETLQMALCGVFLGVIFSLPLGFLGAANTCPNPLIRLPIRWMVAVFRTIPDLIWAMLFLVMVGFGPTAGILAITVDTIGFCGRFYSERVEEVPKGPAEALLACGAGPLTRIVGAVLPEALPSFMATSLYAVEKSVRSAVVLGLVGAGGIGVELRAAMNLFQYQQATTIILMILVVVIAFEQTSATVRSRWLDSGRLPR